MTSNRIWLLYLVGEVLASIKGPPISSWYLLNLLQDILEQDLDLSSAANQDPPLTLPQSASITEKEKRSNRVPPPASGKKITGPQIGKEMIEQQHSIFEQLQKTEKREKRFQKKQAEYHQKKLDLLSGARRPELDQKERQALAPLKSVAEFAVFCGAMPTALMRLAQDGFMERGDLKMLNPDYFQPPEIQQLFPFVVKE